MWSSAQSAASITRMLGPRINRGAIMSTILPTSLLAQPFALSTTFLDELQPLAPLAALDVSAVNAVSAPTPESIAPAASTEVELSPVAQFQSALAQSHQLLDELQTPGVTNGANGAAAAGAQQLSSTDQLHTLTGAAQNLVAAYNLLQTDSASTPLAAAAEAPLLNNLLHSVTQPNPAADASQAAGPATLADIGITLRPTPAIDHGAGLALDAQALQTAYAANPQGTVALVNQTTDTFEQLGDQYARQLSVEAAVPPLLVAVQAGASGSAGSNSAGVVPAAGVSQDTLADLALLDAFAGSATQAQSASSASNEAAALAQLDQLDQLQQQHQLDQARDAYATQLAALPPQAGAARTPAAPGANTIPSTQNTARTQLGEQATQAQLAQQLDAEQYAARLLDNKRLADSATQQQDDAATQLRIVEQQQESAASAAQTQVLSASAAALAEQQQTAALADAAALTLTENAALTQEASAANPAAADELAAESAVADAQAGVGATATPAAIAAAPAQTAPDNGAGNADPLAVNPALAAAIAAYRLGGATAPVQSRPAPPTQRPEPVQKVAPVDPVDSASDAPPS